MVKILIKKSYIKIYIDELLHLSAPKEDIVGFQSYLQGHIYCIKYYLRNNSEILCEYEKRELWEEILKEIDKQNIV
jgi:hypothetical protein